MLARGRLRMRILHTADWHLGHTLRSHARTAEHERFLAWLVATVVERQVDVLLIAGDVFDAANPPPAVWRLWFGFLGELKAKRPSVQVVVIAGNHDSAARLEAPQDLLRAFDVRVVGALRRDAAGRPLVDELLVPLRSARGDVAAWCVAVPFLRSSDVLLGGVPGGDGADEAGDPLVAGMRVLHDELFEAARARRQPGQALVAMAHGYLVGGALSELSERKVLGGNQHALPVDLFPRDCCYVALGHLHRPQALAGLEHVRYSGSPLPLSMPERLHAHHVVFADLDGERLAKTWSLRVPRTVELLRLPERGELAPEDAVAAVEALEDRAGDEVDDELPFLEVAVRLAAPSPQIVERISRVAESKRVRLVRVEALAAAVASALPGAAGADVAEPLQSLTPEDVFVRRYLRDYEAPVPEPLLVAFRELLDAVEHEDGA
jgi:DNA repair protein SbcD/Mre11